MTELHIPFEEHLVPFTDGRSWDVFRHFSPSGQVPCLHHGEEVVWDSLAIVEYLAERHAQVWPTATRARTWARSATAEMHAGFTALRDACPMAVNLRLRPHRLTPAAARDLERLAELWAEGIERFGGPFLGGNAFGGVDAFFCPIALRVQSWHLPLPQPAMDYVQRLLALPGMQQWQQAARTEPYREPAEERRFAALGEILEDLRQ